MDRAVMQRPPPLTFARLVSAPENRAALLAVQDLIAHICSHRSLRANPLFLHGPTGTGKTHLTSALVEAVTRQSPGLVVTVLQAGDFDHLARAAHSAEEAEAEQKNRADTLRAARHGDLLVLEDLQ